jgi:hypothetical protein
MIYLWHLFILWAMEYPKSALIADLVFGFVVFLFVLGGFLWISIYDDLRGGKEE